MKIKASHITNLTDARYFAARNVTWMSFDFRENSTNYIDPMKARAMFEWIEGPVFVGEFDRLTADEIKFYTEGWGLQAVQVGMFTPLETVKALNGISVIKEIWIEAFTNITVLEKTLKSFSKYAGFFQLNFEKGGIAWHDLIAGNAMISFDELKALCQDYKIILDIDFQQIELRAIGELKLSGLNLKGSTEERIGVKSFDEMDEILDAIDESFA